MTAIITSKGILGGKPRISGTLMSVDAISDYLTHGYGVKEIKRDYPHFTDSQIDIALKYLEKKVAEERKSLESAAK